MYISLEQAKKHLLVEHNEDDLYIADLITVAEDAVRIDLNRDSLCELEDANGTLPPAVCHAILLFVGTMYANRESISYGSPKIVPHSYDYLLSLHRQYIK